MTKQGPTPAQNIFPITKDESVALHALGWNSGYGWADQFDWYHMPSHGSAIFVENDREWMAKFLSDLEGIRRTESERLRKERLHAAAEDLLEALEEWLAGYDGWSNVELAKRADPTTIARISRSRAAIAKATP